MLSFYEINSWKTKGYVVKSGIFDNKLIDKCIKFMNKRNPDPGFGSNGELEFPSNTVLDDVTINENLINCVQQLLNCYGILLTQCDSWSKGYNEEKNSQKNTDQRMHMDYGNNTFLHPSEWDNPEAVSAIVYLSDTSLTGGQTAVVERKKFNTEFPYINMPGQAGYLFYNDKTSAEQYFKNNYKNIFKFRKKLYQNEIPISAKPGDVLFYRLDTWHRGTPVKKDKIRHVMNLCWKKKECYWINQWNSGWTQKMYYGWLEKMFIRMSPKQRSVLGIPLPGDKYWNFRNLLNLQSRYPGIDLRPYLSKL